MESDDIAREERGLYFVIIGAMIPIVFGTLLAHDVFDAGATISSLLVVLASLGLAWRRSSLPTARTRK